MIELIYIIIAVIVFVIAQCLFRSEVIEGDLATELIMDGVCLFTAVFWPLILVCALMSLATIGLEKMFGVKNG